ncbi:hypothetical protein HDV05_002921 [Chytridiales sp. JEL 0842]|nr:hypothetical protein HDV05_002921 [Chytridiales sp. JEL 0842]
MAFWSSSSTPAAAEKPATDAVAANVPVVEKAPVTTLTTTPGGTIPDAIDSVSSNLHCPAITDVLSVAVPSKQISYMQIQPTGILDRIFMTTTNKEEQTSAKQIVYLHTINRSVGLFASLATVSAVARKVYWLSSSPSLFRSLYRFNTFATLAGVGYGAWYTHHYMKNKQETEWRTDAWGLLTSKGQNKADMYGAVGSALGVLGGSLVLRKEFMGVRLLGGLGLGTAVGLAAFELSRRFELETQLKEAFNSVSGNALQ